MTDVGWGGYWDSLDGAQPVFAAEAADTVNRLLTGGLVSEGTRFLDMGCGFGHVDAGLAQHVQSVAIWDPSPGMLAAAVRTNSDRHQVSPVDPMAAEGHAFDVVLVHSVVQYLTFPELARNLDRWSRLLSPNGCILLSDLLAPGMSGTVELLQFLIFALRRRILLAALSAARQEWDRYSKWREQSPLLTLSERRVADLAAAQGFSAVRLESKLGYRRQRFSMRLVPHPA